MMNDSNQAGPTILVIFGAAGDLAWRKLAPALYNLFMDGWLSDQFAVIGLDKKPSSDDELRQRFHDGINQFSRQGSIDETRWAIFSPKISYIQGDFSDPGLYQELLDKIHAVEKTWKNEAVHAFYLATPPFVVETIVSGLGKAGLAKNRRLDRVVIEKPFGHDLDSAVALNRMLMHVFEEPQIYRIDHYLGKETVQNILAFRFANALFEPIWDRRYIDHVQITVSEQVGVEHRGEYYEHAGALRDMVQNHLLQILCLIAMEPMVSFDADEIRNKKVDLLRALRPIPKDQIQCCAFRGQYTAGEILGQQVAGYREEPDVRPDSSTETFAALKLYVDNWRWQDVPFYLRTGKRLPVVCSEAIIQFRPVPHQSFPPSASEDWEPNRLVIRIQPEEGILFKIQAKQPGPNVLLGKVDLHFYYKETFKKSSPEAYETLLLDIMRGDATLFMRSDQIEASWKVIMPVLQAWENSKVKDLPGYPAGTWGPDEAQELVVRDGRSWIQPFFPQASKNPL